MSVLMISPSYGSKIGGAEIQLKKLYKILKNNNDKIDIFIISKKSLACSDLLYPYNFYVKSLMQIIKKKINIIHIHTFSSPAWIFAFFNFFLKKKVLVKITDSGNNSRLQKIYNNYLLKILFIIVFKKKDIYFVSINRKIQRVLIKLGIKKKNIFKIQNGVEVKSKHRNIKKNCDLIYFGRLIKRKSIFEVIKLIYEKKLLYIKFDIYGEGPERKRLKTYIKKNNLKNISINKFINHIELRKKLKKYKFSINASKSEGMSNSILESLSQGVPVICSNIEENRDLIANNYNGYIFKNKNDLSRLLKLIIKNKNYEKISKNALNSVNKFNIIDIAEIYKKKYKNFLLKNLHQLP